MYDKVVDHLSLEKRLHIGALIAGALRLTMFYTGASRRSTVVIHLTHSSDGEVARRGATSSTTLRLKIGIIGTAYTKTFAGVLA